MLSFLRKQFPTWGLALLLGIGFIDLVSTAVLYSHGQIVELNPIMRPLLEHSAWAFVVVKGITLVGCWYVMRRYWEQNAEFVRKACFGGSAAYLLLWIVWFIVGSF